MKKIQCFCFLTTWNSLGFFFCIFLYFMHIPWVISLILMPSALTCMLITIMSTACLFWSSDPYLQLYTKYLHLTNKYIPCLNVQSWFYFPFLFTTSNLSLLHIFCFRKQPLYLSSWRQAQQSFYLHSFIQKGQFWHIPLIPVFYNLPNIALYKI